MSSVHAAFKTSQGTTVYNKKKKPLEGTTLLY